MRYYITSHMKNGDKWVTPRDSFEEMNTVIECIVKDKEVLKFTVEEKWTYLLQLVQITVIGAYFGGRSFEKRKK